MAFNTLNFGVKIPCVQGGYSPHLVTYTTQIPPKALEQIIGYDPRSANWKNLSESLQAIYRTLQRPTVADRRESIGGYIEDRIGPQAGYIGGFPGISIAVQNPVAFRAYDADNGDIAALGYIDFELSNSNLRIVIDGLGRLTGALDKIDEGRDDIVDSFTIPVTFFVPTKEHGPLSIEEMGQLFHDFNFRVSPVRPQLAIALDQSDIYIRLTNKLAEAPVIATSGGMAQRVASLGQKSTELVAQTVLLRAVRGAMEGHDFQEANLTEIDNPNLTKETFQQNLADLTAYLTRFAEVMGGERFRDRDSLHLSAPGWQAIGVVFDDIHHRLKLDSAKRDPIVTALGSIDWSRTNPDWQLSGLLVTGTDKKTGDKVLKFGGAGRSNRAALLAYLRAKAGLDILLRQTEPPAQQAAE
jgi:DGQHR domain-containing protein